MPHRSRYKKHVADFNYNKLPLPENFDLKDIIYKIYEDVERINRGHQVDLILPFWFGYPLGYHSIMYYPKENLEVYLPDARAYKTKFSGWHHEFDINERIEKEFKGFKKYHVDKPFTDFIRIYDLYQRKGISFALMKKSIEFCLEKFGVFYFSNATNDKSAPMFEKVKEHYKIHKEKGDGIYSDSERFFIRK